MTSRSAATPTHALPQLPWHCYHAASSAPRADRCDATGRLTTSRYRMAAAQRSFAPPHSAEVWRGMQDLVLKQSTKIVARLPLEVVRGLAAGLAAPDDKHISSCALLLTSGPIPRVAISQISALDKLKSWRLSTGSRPVARCSTSRSGSGSEEKHSLRCRLPYVYAHQPAAIHAALQRLQFFRA